MNSELLIFMFRRPTLAQSNVKTGYKLYWAVVKKLIINKLKSRYIIQTESIIIRQRI